MDKYLLTAKELKQIKIVAKIINIDWKTLAARPSQAKEWIAKYENGELK